MNEKHYLFFVDYVKLVQTCINAAVLIFTLHVCEYDHARTHAHTQKQKAEPGAKCSIYLCLTPLIELLKSTQQ